MADFEKLVKNIAVDFCKPKQLEQLSLSIDDKAKSSFIDTTNFEFPPKPISLVIALFLKEGVDSLNFFDYSRLLTTVKFGQLEINEEEEKHFFERLASLHDDPHFKSKKLLLRLATEMLIDISHKYHEQISDKFNSSNIELLKALINESFDKTHNLLEGYSLESILKELGVKDLLSYRINPFRAFLINKIKREGINHDLYEGYLKDLFPSDDFEVLYSHTQSIIEMLEEREQKNDILINKLLIAKLGDVLDARSYWYEYQIPSALVDRYKKVKGLYEFKRFEKIAASLAQDPDLQNQDLKENGTNDAKRLLNRTLFWTNYEQRFQAVDMWLTNKEYQQLTESKQDLESVKILDDINVPVCIFYFENITVVNWFFNSPEYRSLIFVGEHSRFVSDKIKGKKFTKDVYKSIQEENLSYKISYLPNWQGWLEDFLRTYEILPNDSILAGRSKFKVGKHSNIQYCKDNGLEKSKKKALENGVTLQRVVVKNGYQ